MDLYEEKELNIANEWEKIYSAAGYKVIQTSAVKNFHVMDVNRNHDQQNHADCRTQRCWKSTLINAIVPEMNLRVGELSGYHEKGKHTTTFAECLSFHSVDSSLDTPGIKEFGILDIEESEVSHYFPEMEKRLHDCRFNNCLHINEPGCAVKDAIEKGKIAMSRYENYLSIIMS